MFQYKRKIGLFGVKNVLKCRFDERKSEKISKKSEKGVDKREEMW